MHKFINSKKLLMILIVLTSLLFIQCNNNRDISSLLKSSNENDMARGSSKIIDGNKQNHLFVPLLIKVLKRAKSSGAKCNAILALQVNRKYASSAVPVLIACLKDKDQKVICNTADLLGVLTYRSSKAVSALLDTLAKNKENIKVRLHIIKALGKIGTGATSAVPILEENLRSTDHLIIIETRNSLYKILGEQFSALPGETFVRAKKVKIIPTDVDTISFEQEQDEMSRITALFEGKKFPDRSTLYIYLKNNIGRFKSKKVLVVLKGKISDFSVGAIINLLLESDIPVYGKSSFYDKVKYSLPLQKLDSL